MPALTCPFFAAKGRWMLCDHASPGPRIPCFANVSAPGGRLCAHLRRRLQDGPVERKPDTKRTIIEFVDCRIARKISQRSLALFSSGLRRVLQGGERLRGPTAVPELTPRIPNGRPMYPPAPEQSRDRHGGCRPSWSTDRTPNSGAAVGREITSSPASGSGRHADILQDRQGRRRGEGARHSPGRL